MNNLEQRQKFILKEIERWGSVSVLKLAEILYVSGIAIRRDLTALEKIGLVRRTHEGGSIH